MTTALATGIPLVDLQRQHAMIAKELEAAISDVVGSGAFVAGPAVAAFEAAYAQFIGVRHVAGVANGTDALELILRALGIGPGHEVVVPALTFVATASAVARSGATPVFADVDPDTLLLDLVDARRRVGPQTRAIVAVHLYGQTVPTEQLGAMDGVVLVEDAAQAQGARRRDVPAGRLGIAAATSFYPGKNLGALGDAGAVLTDDDGLNRAIRALRNHGSEIKYEHPQLGFNSRLDSIQAAVLGVKLRHLAVWNQARRAAASRYDRLLSDIEEVCRPTTVLGNEHVWHLYVIRVPHRDRVVEALNHAGIGAGIHYPQPLHRLGAFANLGYRTGAFPVAEAATTEILSLPLYPEITEQEQERVVAELRHALSEVSTRRLS